MAQVTNRNADKYRYISEEDFDNRKDALDLLRDKIIKHHFMKQTCTSVNESDIAGFAKKFTNGVIQGNELSSLEGKLTAKDYRIAHLHYSINEALNLYQGSNECNKFIELYNKKSENEIELNSLLSKVLASLPQSDTETERFHSALPLNRHEFEEYTGHQAFKSDTALSGLVYCKPHDRYELSKDHPVNFLQKLEKELFSNAFCNHKTKRKIKSPTLKFKYFKKKPNSLWDMTKIPIILTKMATKELIAGKSANEIIGNTFEESGISFVPKAISGEAHSFDSSRPFIWKLNPSILTPLAYIASNRSDKIKHQVKCKDNHSLKPSSCLYIKNLPRNVTAKDLVSVFGNYEACDKKAIEYRLLKGRMKGQAFVTFANAQIAMEALNTCNGYKLTSDKAMVIEFSKNKSQS